MFTKRRSALVLTLLATAGVALLARCGDDRGNASAFDLDGHEVHPLADSGAKVNVLVFLRTDCPISNRYAPEIRRLYDAFVSRDVAFWLVYPDADQPVEAIRKHLETYEYSCPALRDSRHTLVDLTRATITPECAVFDASGTMVYRGRIDDRYVSLGETRPAPTMHDLQEALEATLRGLPVAQRTTTAIGCFISDLGREET